MISRIFRGDNENAAIKRKRQIDTLKIFNDNVIELREDAEYQVQFDAGDKRMAIIVSLSPEFPLEKPVLRISPSVINHPWCNEHSEIVNAPGLINFTVHSDLGRVVQAIIREFSKNPPSQFHEDVSLATNTLHRNESQDGTFPYGLQRYPDLSASAAVYNSSCYNSQYPKYSSNPNIHKYNYINTSVADDEQATFASTSYRLMYPNNHHHPTNSLHNVNTNTISTTTTTATTTTSSSASNNHSMQYFANHQSTSYMNPTCYNMKYPQSMSNFPPIHSIVNLEFPELNNLSNEELMELRQSGDDNIDAFLDEYSRLEDIHSSIDEIINSVEEMANSNLAKEAELKTLQDEITSKIQTVSQLKTHYDYLIQQYNKLSEAFTPDHIRECLKQVADDSHEQSEKIAENFLEKKIDVERFLSTYIECRKLGQARRTKEEKLAHQLNELKRAGYY
ncbi:hypothetical protein PV327_004894 [Microctonus hyperodae]|uniref:VPS37 C-terminal domain-containing protein n=1 Tax=Microctonus hyperodae TaxID=165561 RepID=A0AA39FDD9_MICHY|nr:hypothetical protein PV327_004894 [Microctonus hyperodae]